MKFAFDGYVLDGDSHELLHGGVAVPLSPKAFQLLSALLEHRPRALSKQALMALLWPGTAVVEANLSNLIGEIRAALGEDSRHPRFVRTVQRFGYAFRGGQEAEPPPAAPGVLRLKWPGGTVVVPPGEHVIGRDPDLALCLASASVSRRHALLRVRPDRTTIEDLGSKNGTAVNGRRVAGEHEIQDGDEIVAGSIRLTVRRLPPPGVTETAVSRAGRS